jgi:hypothetical protein
MAAVDDLGQLLQHREKEEEVSHELKPREEERCTQRRLSPGARDSGGGARPISMWGRGLCYSGAQNRTGMCRGRQRRSRMWTGRAQVTVSFSNYSNVFKRLEWIRSKEIFPGPQNFQIKYGLKAFEIRNNFLSRNFSKFRMEL